VPVVHNDNGAACFPAGKLAAQYLAKSAPPVRSFRVVDARSAIKSRTVVQGLRWAIAGRSESKLNEVKRGLGVADSSFPGLVIADGDQPASIDALTRDTRYSVAGVACCADFPSRAGCLQGGDHHGRALHQVRRGSGCVVCSQWHGLL
jgi:hypothetical protein